MILTFRNEFYFKEFSLDPGKIGSAQNKGDALQFSSCPRFRRRQRKAVPVNSVTRERKADALKIYSFRLMKENLGQQGKLEKGN